MTGRFERFSADGTGLAPVVELAQASTSDKTRIRGSFCPRGQAGRPVGASAPQFPFQANNRIALGLEYEDLTMGRSRK